MSLRAEGEVEDAPRVQSQPASEEIATLPAVANDMLLFPNYIMKVHKSRLKRKAGNAG